LGGGGGGGGKKNPPPKKKNPRTNSFSKIIKAFEGAKWFVVPDVTWVSVALKYAPLSGAGNESCTNSPFEPDAGC